MKNSPSKPYFRQMSKLLKFSSATPTPNSLTLEAKKYFQSNPRLNPYNDQSMGKETGDTNAGTLGDLSTFIYGKSNNGSKLGFTGSPEHKRSQTMEGIISAVDLGGVGRGAGMVKRGGSREKFAGRKYSVAGLCKGPGMVSGKSFAEKQVDRCRSLSKGGGKVYSQKGLERDVGHKIIGETSNGGFDLIGDADHLDLDSEKLVQKAAKRGTT
jgi:hypothetical protein